jgi:hypothetical protein
MGSAMARPAGPVGTVMVAWEVEVVMSFFSGVDGSVLHHKRVKDMRENRTLTEQNMLLRIIFNSSNMLLRVIFKSVNLLMRINFDCV